MFGIEIIADGLVIKIFVPVNMHGAGNMSGVIQRDIFVALNDADLGIIQMLDDPSRIYQCFGVGVLAIVHSLILFEVLGLMFQNSPEHMFSSYRHVPIPSAGNRSVLDRSFTVLRGREYGIVFPLGRFEASLLVPVIPETSRD